MRKKVENALIDMGIYPNLSGFDYICRMIELIQADTKKEKTIGAMYKEVAAKTGKTALSVEKAIRHAISKINMGSKSYKQYIGINNTSNSVVLRTMAINLRED